MPILVKPALIGWKGKDRRIDLTIEREFTGAELIGRMKGWITIDPKQAVEVFQRHGRLKCFETQELVVEVEDGEALEALRADLTANFGDQCDIEPVRRDG